MQDSRRRQLEFECDRMHKVLENYTSGQVRHFDTVEPGTQTRDVTAERITDLKRRIAETRRRLDTMS